VTEKPPSYGESYARLMQALGPPAERAVKVTPDVALLSSEEVEAIKASGNDLLRAMDRARAEERLRIVRGDDGGDESET